MELTEQVLDTAKRCQNLECDGCHYCIPGCYEGNGCDFKSFARDAEVVIKKLQENTQENV